MLLRVSKHDEVIPYNGVVQYVTKLRQCMRRYSARGHVHVRSARGHHDNGDMHYHAAMVTNILL